MPGVQNLSPAIKTAKTVQEKTPYISIFKQFEVSKSTVSYIMELFRQTDDVRRHSISGRTRVTTNKDDKILIWSSKRNPLKNVVDLNTKMRKNYKVSSNTSTTKEWLCHAGLFGHRLAKKPMISRKNQMGRLKFSREHRNWIDESKYNLFGNIKVWGCFSRAGVGLVHRVEGNMDRFIHTLNTNFPIQR
jgi:hypothetical protein